MLRFFTSGESHGKAGLAFIEGLPAGLKIDFAALNAELARRQGGYGRSSRQKTEKDEAQVLSGIRHGITTGAPITLLINNRESENWTHVMSTTEVNFENEQVIEQLEKKAIRRFRPGHADLAGTLKFRQRDIRDVLERSSARETAARVAAGALCQQLLLSMGIKSTTHVLQVGSIKANENSAHISLAEIENRISQSDLLCIDNQAAEQMKQLINETWQAGDTLGGVVEVIVEGLPVGLGNYIQWDLKLDGKLAQALMSVQAVKAVEMGDGFQSAGSLGSHVHDAIYPASTDSPLPFTRRTNNAGGLEGGMTNGERLIVRAYMKPLPTLREGLDSLSFPEFTEHKAHYERSDVCAVPACAIVCKAMVNIVLAAVLLDKFGGDNIIDLETAIRQYKTYCQNIAQTNNAHPSKNSVKKP
jgi:chorismate synthase